LGISVGGAYEHRRQLAHRAIPAVDHGNLDRETVGPTTIERSVFIAASPTDHRPQSSSASRFTAEQAGEWPERWRESAFRDNTFEAGDFVQCPVPVARPQLPSSPAISCTSITILRRRSALSIRMNAPISLKPSELATKSSIWAIDNAPLSRPRGADALGAPSKKNATGTCRMREISCNRPAPMRFLVAPATAHSAGRGRQP
jgi:hypothetical protein